MSDQDNDWDDKSDLTRIEDLSDFLHEEDPELDHKLEQLEKHDKDEEKKDQLEDQEEDLFENDDQNFELSEEDDNDATEDSFEVPPEFSHSHDQEREDPESENIQEDFQEGFQQEFGDSQSEESEEGQDLEGLESLEGSDEGLFDESIDPHVQDDDIQDAEDAAFEEAADNLDNIQTELESSASFARDQEPVAEKPNVTKQETFSDVLNFGNNISYGTVSSGGNPPYSILIRNITYQEDADEIMGLLKEYGIVTPEIEQTTKQGLESGNLLISQISEYSAIFMAHKLRRFKLDMRIGLSDQLHTSKSYQGNGKGLVSKQSLTQNLRDEDHLKEKLSSVNEVSLLPALSHNNYHIKRYIDLITSHTLMSAREISDSSKKQIEYSQEMGEHYKSLAEELKRLAYKKGANAVNDIHYTLTPAPDDNSIYKLTCTGHALWVVFTD